MPANPHRRLSQHEGADLVAAWLARVEGMTRVAFCHQRQIGPWVLRYWLTRGAGQARSGFVRVIRPPCASALEVGIGAARIRLHRDFDPELLRAVVSCLSGSAC